MQNYIWRDTPEIKQFLVEIEALKLLITKYPPNPEILTNIRRHSLLKSAVYSARIENIPVEISDPGVHRKLEVQNLLSSYNYLQSPKLPKKLNVNLIKHFHKLVLKNLSYTAGSFRKEPWAIYNQAGVAVYLAPLHTLVPELLDQFVQYINSLDCPVPQKSAIAQFIFEKIHPFADGNGRVGRLISSFLLKIHGYDFSGINSFEEYIDSHRDLYYQALMPSKDLTEFITYFLKALVNSVQSTLETTRQTKQTSSLLPRRQEILDIIRDHPLCSFNFLKRRFTSIPDSTLHFDLQSLIKNRLITKHGISRGAVYSASKE